MKKVELVCVGKIKEAFIRDGIKEYAKRLTRFCDFSIFEVADFASDDCLQKESALILKRILASNGFKILLDIEGEMLSSEQISTMIEKSFEKGYDKIYFIIGGSRGVTEELKKACDFRLSFGRVTYPHQLMRLILSEQIYRAFSIKEGLPYHK